MSLVELHRHPPRLYIGTQPKRHLHHGLTGSVLIAIGVILVVTDWKDRPFPLIDDREYYNGEYVKGQRPNWPKFWTTVCFGTRR